MRIGFILLQVFYHIVGALGFRLLQKILRTIISGGIDFVWSNVFCTLKTKKEQQ